MKGTGPATAAGAAFLPIGRYGRWMEAFVAGRVPTGDALWLSGIGVAMPEAAVCSSVALIAEDEWLIRMDIAEALLNAGWQVIEAATGEQALALADGTLANGAGAIDLLVTDIQLGGMMSGWDLAETLRLKRPAVAVIYASATPAAERRQVAGSVFVEKPFRIDTLMQICSRLTGHGLPC